MSVDAWLDSVILDSALQEGVEPRGSESDEDSRPTQPDHARERDDDDDGDRDPAPRPRRGYPERPLDRRTSHDDELFRSAREQDYFAGYEEALPRRRHTDFEPGYDTETAADESDVELPSGGDRTVANDDHPASERPMSYDDALRRAEALAERLSLSALEDRYRPLVDQGFADVNGRLDSLTRQLGEIAQMSAASPPSPEPQDSGVARQFADAMSQLDRRFDQLIEEGRSAKVDMERELDRRLDLMISEGRSAKTVMEQRVDAVDRALADLHRDKAPPTFTADPPTPLDQALIEIADRQRMLDGYTPVAAARGVYPAATPNDALPRAHTQELSGLEHQLRQINTRIETLQQPCGLDKAVETLRNDLAEIGVVLQDAVPRKAIEALEGEVRSLAERIDQTRHAGADEPALAGVERGLAEVRDALRDLTPAENLVGVDHAVRHLTQKVDLIAETAQDPSALRQLEDAIVMMRGIASHVASNDALTKLSDDVRALTEKVDHAAAQVDSGALSALEQRIATLADALEARNQRGQVVPHELETVVKGLVDKIDRIQLTQPDHTVLGQLEDRIAKLVEKLDASDARLNHLETIERGLAELLLHLEHQRVPNLVHSGAQSAPEEVEALSRDVADLRETERKTLDSLEAVHGTLGHVVDRLAMIETDMRGRPEAAASAPMPPSPPAFVARPPVPEVQPSVIPAGGSAADPSPTPAPQPSAAQRPIEPQAAAASQPTKPVGPAPERRPIDPTLPPDHPLEPGSGMRGRNPGSPADRIAASEAALAGAKPTVIPDPAGKSNFIAAARRAAQAAGQTPAARPKTSGDIASAASRLASRVGKLRTLIAGGSAILLVLGALEITRTLLISADDAPANRTHGARSVASKPVAAKPIENGAAMPAVTAATAPPAQPSSPSLTVAANRQPPALPMLGATGSATPAPGIIAPPNPPSQAQPAAKTRGALAAAERDITGSVASAANPANSSAPVPPAAPATGPDKLPAAFGALRTAATKGDATAQFEVAARYAEGRGVPQNLTDAAEWFERAAKQGLAPAQFRLGGLYEKGLGVKKDLETARRLYLAAGEAGNGKALHNLAVLYAEGVDGRPDYQTAAKWFRKAADYGVTDSQYNLAILYARGIGVESNMTEAYKWFALAAREGDADSAKKRDDIASHLDPDTLKAAKQAVQSWAPVPQPDAAVQVKAPAGGWSDGAPATPAPKRKSAAVGSAAMIPLDLATPRSAQ